MSTCLITLINSRRVFFTSSNCSSKNVWRFCNSSYSSRASGLIGPIKRSSRSNSRTREIGETFSGNSGIGVSIAACGSHEWSRRSASTVPSRRIFTSASSTSIRRFLSRRSSRPCSFVVRSLRASSKRCEIARTSSLCLRRTSCNSAWRASNNLALSAATFVSRFSAVRLASTFVRRSAATTRASTSAFRRASTSARRDSRNCRRSCKPAVFTSRSLRNTDNKPCNSACTERRASYALESFWLFCNADAR